MAHVNSKISRAMFSINQVKHFLPYDSMKTLYFSLVHPHILYGILAWGNAKAATLQKTIVLQTRGLSAWQLRCVIVYAMLMISNI